MPIYEYRCESCGEQYDKLVSIGAPAPPCPKCASEDVRKLVSAAAFVLKGSGWYKDHYGLKKGSSSKGGKESGGKESGGKSESSSSSDSKSGGSDTSAAAA